MDMPLVNKRIVVAGATSGIGLAVAELLVKQGAAVIGVGRSAERCRAAEHRLRLISPGVPIQYCVADLSLLSEVRRLTAQIKEILASWGGEALDGLVYSAGTFTFWMALTAEGFEMQWAVNHLAPFLLTHELLPSLQAASLARVVTVSSGSHYNTHLRWEDIQLRRRYNGLLAYQQTKLANVLFTAELNRRLGTPSTVRAFAADPGLVRTDIGLKGNPRLVRWAWRLRRDGGIPPEQAAQGVAYLVSEPSIQDSPHIYWKHGVPKEPSPEALNEDSARRLWALSEQMCGIPMEVHP